MAVDIAPVSPAAIRPRTVTIETHALVGRLMDCQILAAYAEQALCAVSCPCSDGPASVARDAIGKLRGLLWAETGRLDGAEASA